jgi:hypothetical protein
MQQRLAGREAAIAGVVLAGNGASPPQMLAARLCVFGIFALTVGDGRG